jgi:hypothetical protein
MLCFPSNPFIPEKFDQYGGWKGIRSNATGFFRVEEIGGVWWFITPEGHVFISVGVNCIGLFERTEEGVSPYYENITQIYENLYEYTNVTLRRFKDYGFNTLGCWSQWRFITENHPTPYVVFLNLGGKFARGREGLWRSKIHGNSFPDVFDASFKESCLNNAKEVSLLATDPWLVGYFTDNELEWNIGWDQIKELIGKSCEGKKALVYLLEERYEGNVSWFNRVYNTSIESFEELLNLTELPPNFEIKNKERALQDLDAFRRLVSQTYFKTVLEAIRKYDKNHLILGCRFYNALKTPLAIIEVMRDYVDLISVNDYWSRTPRRDVYYTWEQITGKPVLITEFSFRAMDSGLPNTVGAGLIFETQRERAEAYKTFVEKVIETPFIVGCHWFKWHDNPKEGVPKGGILYGENSNYGIVNVTDTPYKLLVEAMTETHENMYKKRARSLNQFNFYQINIFKENRYINNICLKGNY